MNIRENNWSLIDIKIGNNQWTLIISNQLSKAFLTNNVSIKNRSITIYFKLISESNFINN